MDLEVRKQLADGLRGAADLLGEGTPDGQRRKAILNAVDAVRSALLGMGFNEGAGRKLVVSFLRSVSLANGVIGQRTAHRLCHRTFEDDADGAFKWLLDNAYLEDAGSEGFVLSEAGYQYLDANKADLSPAPAERKGERHGPSRPRASRQPREAKAAARGVRQTDARDAGAARAVVAVVAEPVSPPSVSESAAEGTVAVLEAGEGE